MNAVPEQEIDQEMSKALIRIKHSESFLRRKLVKNLRLQLIREIDGLNMNFERKSYFLHQISYEHEIEGLVELVKEINERQSTKTISDADLIFLIETSAGIIWKKCPSTIKAP